MWDYLPLIITAVLIAGALAWWLVSLNSVSKSGAPQKEITPPKVVPAPPVAATPPPTAKLMDDPTPASKTASPKAQAPLKVSATKAAPAKAAKPAVKKIAAPAKAAPKPAATKAVVAKVAAPKAKVEAPKTKVEAKSKPAPAPKVAAKPKAAVKPKAAPKVVVPDDLGLLKGVGPKLMTLLQSLGVTSFGQVANWSAADIAEIDAKLGNFAGRIGRDNWVDQAKLLSSGDIAGFEKKYGALGSEVKKG